jgi:hypothetical protein
LPFQRLHSTYLTNKTHREIEELGQFQNLPQKIPSFHPPPKSSDIGRNTSFFEENGWLNPIVDDDR